MSCAEKKECEKLKVFNHACVLACQQANIGRVVLGVVKLTHQHYGDYYKGIDYDRARAEGRKVLRKFSPGDTMAVQNSNRNRGRKVSADT